MNDRDKYFSKALKWFNTEDAEYPLVSNVNEECWRIRINDFPEEPLYTLFIEKRLVVSFNDWPSSWKKP